MALILFLILQRLAELLYARRNTRKLLARGAVEYGAGHYPLIVGFHLVWLLALAWCGWQQPLDLGWLSVFAALQLARIWVLASLGDRWTTRIIILNAPLIRRGPYRWVSHPNYLIVAAEIFVAPMVLGQWQIAVIFSLLHVVVLTIRIKAENHAIAQHSTV